MKISVGYRKNLLAWRNEGRKTGLGTKRISITLNLLDLLYLDSIAGFGETKKGHRSAVIGWLIRQHELIHKGGINKKGEPDYNTQLGYKKALFEAWEFQVKQEETNLKRQTEHDIGNLETNLRLTLEQNSRTRKEMNNEIEELEKLAKEQDEEVRKRFGL